MGAVAANLPGSLNLSLRRGDEYGTLVDFSVSLTGYTFSSQIYSTFTGDTIATPTVTAVDLSVGQVNVGMTELQTAALQAGTYGWRLIWVAPGNVTRTALQGFVEVVA
jgi:hypothetical protein